MFYISGYHDQDIHIHNEHNTYNNTTNNDNDVTNNYHEGDGKINSFTELHIYNSLNLNPNFPFWLIHSPDPQSRPVVIIVFTHVVRTSIRPFQV